MRNFTTLWKNNVVLPVLQEQASPDADFERAKNNRGHSTVILEYQDLS